MRDARRPIGMRPAGLIGAYGLRGDRAVPTTRALLLYAPIAAWKVAEITIHAFLV